MDPGWEDQERTPPLGGPRSAAPLLAAPGRRQDARGLLFEGRNQKPHGITWLWKQVARYCRQANLPRVCPHSLRGLHASLAMAAGCTSNAVASALGHGSFAITAKHYVDPDTLHNSTVRRFSSSLTTTRHADEDLAQLLERLRALPAETLCALLRTVAAQTGN